MLLKGCQTLETEKKSRTTGNKQHRSTANAMKLTSTVSSPRGQRKMVQRAGSKRPATGKRISGHGMLEVPAVDPCDSSNDSGLGFEHHSELQVARSALRYADHELHWANQGTAVKRKKMEIKLESDDANDNFTFEETIIQAKRDPMHSELHLPLTTRLSPVRAPVARVVSRRPAVATAPRRGGAPTAAANQQLAFSRQAPKPFLQILSQPEQQHRARYQTEGSRGAVKDRSGNSFPTVKLVGYEGQATLQVFIGSDVGRAVPHMFYQACRVSGKNSTPCTEKTVDGTVVIEVEFEAAKDMIVTCDCVGILKERNVDVEHRFPDQSGARSKKKSTRCRMVFRTIITLADGTKETLEMTSQHIVCTQPPGIPEICKKSLSSSPCEGGQELFILGKNFLKDTCVVFTNTDVEPPWEVSVTPDKEYLQQSHLVCVVPAYGDKTLTTPVTIRLSVTSSGKTSEPHSFTYTPAHLQAGICEEAQKSATEVQSGSKQLVGSEAPEARLPTIGGIVRPANAQYLFVQSAHDGGKDAVFLWKPQQGEGSKLPLEDPSTKAMAPQTRPIFLVGHIPSSQKVVVEDRICSPAVPRSPTEHEEMEMTKTLLAAMPTETASDNRFPITTTMDQFASNSVGMPVTSMPAADSLATSVGPDQHFAASNVTVPMATGADLSSTQSPSLATLRRFVSSENTGSPLPSLSVEKFLSGLEHKSGGDPGLQKNLLLLTDNMLRSTLSGRKEECCSLSIDATALPIRGDCQQIPQALQGNMERMEDSSMYQPRHPLNTSQHSSISMDHNTTPSSYTDQLMQGQLMLHGQQTTTTTMTMAKTQNVSSSLISAAQKARLDAMVSSAMESAIPSHSNSQKLEDLLHCAAETRTSLASTVALEHVPLSTLSCMSLTATSEHIYPESKGEGDVEGATAQLPVPSGLMIMPNVFEPSLHPASLLSPALAANGQLINSPIRELLCNSVNSMTLPTVNATESMMVNGPGSMMQSTDCTASTMLDCALDCPSTPLMISTHCASEATVIGDTPCSSVQMTESNQCLPSSIALTNMIMHSTTSSTSMYHPVVPMMQSMLLSAGDRAGDQLSTPETVRLDALVNSALDSHILPTVAPLESKCGIFPGTDAAECHAVGVCPSVEVCYVPATTSSHCCPEQLHFTTPDAAVVNEVTSALLLPAALDKVKSQVGVQATNQEKREEVMVPRELTQMSENDLLSYINPSCFDTL